VNVTVFVVRVWGEQYREELILNVTVFVVRVWGGQYREELILNITVFVVTVWEAMRYNIGISCKTALSCNSEPLAE
jgi:hypothetical protein